MLNLLECLGRKAPEAKQCPDGSVDIHDFNLTIAGSPVSKISGPLFHFLRESLLIDGLPESKAERLFREELRDLIRRKLRLIRTPRGWMPLDATMAVAWAGDSWELVSLEEVR